MGIATITLIVIFIYIVLSGLFFCGRGLNVIRGYRRVEDKDSLDNRKIGKHAGITMLIADIFLMIAMIYALFEVFIPYLTFVVLSLMIIIAGELITGRKIRKGKYNI